MRASSEDRARLHAEVERIVEQLKELGASRVILFGSLARDKISLFSDIDLIVLFERPRRPPRELTRWVYESIHSNESLDILAYNEDSFERFSDRPFFMRILEEGKVLYERSKS